MRWRFKTTQTSGYPKPVWRRTEHDEKNATKLIAPGAKWEKESKEWQTDIYLREVKVSNSISMFADEIATIYLPSWCSGRVIAAFMRAMILNSSHRAGMKFMYLTNTASFYAEEAVLKENESAKKSLWRDLRSMMFTSYCGLCIMKFIGILLLPIHSSES